MTDADAVTIGTAGHIDHGKTALVRALTGVDGDRLPEERARGITIELGFAPIELPGARADAGAEADGPPVRAGMVDVPGHERFVRTMLAGAASIDVGLLVIAADDGVMPQTREHLAILDLLGVRHGVVALAKCDLAEPEWRALVAADVRETLAGTSLASAVIVPTSARRGEGLDELRRALGAAATAAAADRRHALADEPFRLMIDRSFALTGRGTVVTGTAASGTVAVGDELLVHPGGRQVRVRELHVHGASVERAERGRRVAIALAGVHHAEVERGHELASPGAVREGAVLAVSLRMLPDAVRGLRPRERVRLHLGTAVRGARVRLLEDGGLEPGAEGLALLAVDGPVPAVHGQAFVIRAESPPATLGGGTILVPAARPIRRADAGGLAALRGLRAAGGTDRLGAALALRGERRVAPTAAWTDAGLLGAEADAATAALRERGELLAREAGEAGWVHASTRDRWIAAIETAIDRHHRASPLSAGMPREQLATAARGVPEVELTWALAAAVAGGRVREAGGGRLARADFEPDLTPRHRIIRERLLAAYRAGGFRPPDAAEAAGPEARPADVEAMMRLCVSEGELVHLGGGVHLDAEHERELRARVRSHLLAEAAEEGLTMSGLRILLDTTRKHAVPFGEYLDRVGTTRRRGDVRVLADG
jgi:selenocysteine-specific elongation factor